MGKQRTPEQLAQIKDYKDKALLWLDHEGEPRHVQQIRDHLGIGDSMPAVRALETALKQARDEDRRLVQIEGRKGMWRSVRPGQQPLPVPPAAPALPLQPATIAALKVELEHARKQHKWGDFMLKPLAILMEEVGEIAEAAQRQIESVGIEQENAIQDVRREALQVAVVALRIVEEWG